VRPGTYVPVYADAWRAEWIKARTLASTGWLLAATAVLGIGLSAAVCAIVHYRPGGDQDPAKLALSGIQLAQAPAAIWAIRAVTGEYRSGLIHLTLTAVPQRTTVLAAKATVIATLTLAAGTITVVGSVLIGRALLVANGFTTGPTLSAAVSSILCLGLIGLLATGTALALRDTAAATSVVLGLLYLFPLAAQLVGNTAWQRRLQHIGPTTGGLAVLAAWSATSILIGGSTMQHPCSARQ
jgi:ABC-2 type transport system permease protein